LIEGNFPNYQQIVPKSHTTRTILNTEEFLKACRTANIFARSEANVIHISVEPGAELSMGRVEITASSAEMGDSVIDLDASVEGEPVTIAFNARFLMDALSVMDSAQIALETSTSSSPGMLKPLGSEDFVHVIMPMHIRPR
jgi:DNA polymerase-3 subunit beta